MCISAANIFIDRFEQGESASRFQIFVILMYIDVNIGCLVRDGGWDGEITTLAPSLLAAGPG